MASEPTSMPVKLAIRPPSCGGMRPSGFNVSKPIQTASPRTIANMAPRLVARFQ
jgi:hypothetical protein